MQQAQVHVDDQRLDAKRRLISKGSALVRFEYLNWNEYLKLKKKTRPDPEHTAHIKRIFRNDGCRPLPVGHHIPAIIDQHRLDVALEVARRKGRLTIGTLPSSFATIDTRDGYPELEIPGGIQCLHGCHRIQAGKEWLPPTEKWWIVDLYLSDISYDLKLLLVEEYANEEKPCDGEICRKIREYQCLSGEVDSKVSPTTCVSLEMRWWARFNESRERKFRSLIRNSVLLAGFDALRRIPELFDAGMMVTTLHTIIATKCYEEILCYLDHIWKAFNGFLSGIEKGLQRLDKATVRALERRAPGVSISDAQLLRSQVLGGAIFSGFSAQERDIIWGNILTFKGIIPSLSTFFKDVLLLEACVDALKRLITIPHDKSVFSALGDRYKKKAESQLIQTTETTFQSAEGSQTLCMRLGYLVLIAYAMRYNLKLPKKPVKQNLKAIPRVKADQLVLQRLATLAEQVGFVTLEIKALKGDLHTVSILDTQESVPLLVTTGLGESIKQRCGRPNTNAFEEDRKYLFLPNLCEERAETGEGITSFFVLKSWFTAFFDPPGWTRLVLSTKIPNLPPPQAHHQHVDEEDLNMGDLQPEIADQREQEQEQQRIIQVQDLQRMQQRMSWYAKEANRKLEIEQEMQPYFGEPLVPGGLGMQIQGTETQNITIIRFVEREGNESDMLNPLQEYVGQVQELRLGHDDPTSLVEQQVQEFLRHGKRTCDRYKRIVPAEECYSVATREENKNTLFLIPDVEPQREVQEMEGQGYEVAEEEDQVMEGSTRHESPYEIIEEREMEELHTRKATDKESQMTEVQESRRIPQQYIPENADDDNELLDEEKHNAANSRILDTDTTTILVKRRVGDSHDVSKPAKDWEWTDMPSLEVPTGDPQNAVRQRMKMLWDFKHLRPHDSNLRKLEYEDCYRAAEDDADKTLYMMAPSPQTEEKKVVDNTLPLNPLPLIHPEMSHWHPPSIPDEKFHWHRDHNRTRLHTSSQAQEETSFDRTAPFVAPPNIPLFPLPPPPPPPPNIPKLLLPLPPQKKLVESREEFHRDKIGRGPDRGGKDVVEQNKVGMSFEEDDIEIRRRPVNMRGTPTAPIGLIN